MNGVAPPYACICVAIVCGGAGDSQFRGSPIWCREINQVTQTYLIGHRIGSYAITILIRGVSMGHRSKTGAHDIYVAAGCLDAHPVECAVTVISFRPIGESIWEIIGCGDATASAVATYFIGESELEDLPAVNAVSVAAAEIIARRA